MKLEPLRMYSQSLYTEDDTNTTTDANSKNDDDATAWFHMLSWPLGQISEKSHPPTGSFKQTMQGAICWTL